MLDWRPPAAPPCRSARAARRLWCRSRRSCADSAAAALRMPPLPLSRLLLLLPTGVKPGGGRKAGQVAQGPQQQQQQLCDAAVADHVARHLCFNGASAGGAALATLAASRMRARHTADAARARPRLTLPHAAPAALVASRRCAAAAVAAKVPLAVLAAVAHAAPAHQQHAAAGEGTRQAACTASSSPTAPATLRVGQSISQQRCAGRPRPCARVPLPRSSRRFFARCRHAPTSVRTASPLPPRRRSRRWRPSRSSTSPAAARP